MSTIDRLKAEVKEFTAEELTDLADLLSGRHWESWDAQIESDSQSGRLDFLFDDVRTEKSKGRFKGL